MAEYMVDTDICIAVLKHNRPVIDRFVEHQGKVYVSSISCYELQFGIEKGQDLSGSRPVNFRKQNACRE